MLWVSYRTKGFTRRIINRQSTGTWCSKGTFTRPIKNGHDIVLENGDVVLAKDVVAPAKKGFTLSVLGDTKYCEEAIQLSMGADIIVHEATFDGTTTDLAASYGHATNVEAEKSHSKLEHTIYY